MVGDHHSTDSSNTAELNGEAGDMSACHNDSNTCLLQLQFVRSVLSVNPCMVSFAIAIILQLASDGIMNET